MHSVAADIISMKINRVAGNSKATRGLSKVALGYDAGFGYGTFKLDIVLIITDILTNLDAIF
jgi:hypothetical protein